MIMGESNLSGTVVACVLTDDEATGELLAAGARLAVPTGDSLATGP
jgi:hypothetical protein